MKCPVGEASHHLCCLQAHSCRWFRTQLKDVFLVFPIKLLVWCRVPRRPQGCLPTPAHHRQVQWDRFRHRSAYSLGRAPVRNQNGAEKISTVNCTSRRMSHAHRKKIRIPTQTVVQTAAADVGLSGIIKFHRRTFCNKKDMSVTCHCVETLWV